MPFFGRGRVELDECGGSCLTPSLLATLLGAILLDVSIERGFGGSKGVDVNTTPTPLVASEPTKTQGSPCGIFSAQTKLGEHRA